MTTNNHPHLAINRELLTTPRRRNGRGTPVQRPQNIQQHAQKITSQINTAKYNQDTNQTINRDNKYQFTFKLSQKLYDPQSYENIPGVSFVAQTTEDTVILIIDTDGIDTIQTRLAQLTSTTLPPRKDLLFIIDEVGSITPHDRKGLSFLKHERENEFTNNPDITVDVELWPTDTIDRLTSHFEEVLASNEIIIIDKFINNNLILYRITSPIETIKNIILKYRDVYKVDLPPKFGNTPQQFQTDIQDIHINPPQNDDPYIAILDSGVVRNPLLNEAIKEAVDFTGSGNPNDVNGHGTMVAGIALWGDVANELRTSQWTHQLQLLSAKVLGDNNAYTPELMPSMVRKAVHEFYQKFNCRIFNISFGDSRNIYNGGRLSGLAVVLDMLSRELDVLFIVSSGNFIALEHLDANEIRNQYPSYFWDLNTKIIDPAHSLNSLTIGGYALLEETTAQQRYSPNIEEIPIARKHLPSPITRTGPSINSVIKPELIAHAGNQALTRRNRLTDRGLGVLSTSKDFANGTLISENTGTSFAAPYIAHHAAKLLKKYPNASSSLLKALLISSASIPETTQRFLTHYNTQEICGYGIINPDVVHESSPNHVSLFSDRNGIQTDEVHIFEVPIPQSFKERGKSLRTIVISLSHNPMVRNTRLQYIHSRIHFKLVYAQDANEALNAHSQNTDISAISELNNAYPQGTQNRNRHTTQYASWKFKQINRKSKLLSNKLFVLVERNDYPWSQADEVEYYALVIRLESEDNQNLYNETKTMIEARQDIQHRHQVRI